MCRTAPKEQHVALVQRDANPLMRVHPGVTNSAAVGEVNGHSMRAGHDFQAAVGQSGGVDGEIGGQMLDLAYVVVGGRVEVRFEAVAAFCS